ncbi:glutathione synthase [Moraxella caviae]|uniref:Glutathione synthetase n=1 Tax=Moraxella caviae TaxID=34060 RepID=A0A1S9ZX46_9GAMM|nr:glutathione synthase [Moraxella caviae]OOR88092.1 glutathione synthase [Moraxella caviae]STZ09962.1 Glutathione synthetase [Moraxella caviae]VEW11240.1 Glutathione synthetase [Moraxella caviae]
MKKLNFLVVMDDIATINYKKDSTLAMMWAIRERGHGLYYCGIHDLWLNLGELYVDSQPVEVFKNPEKFYELGEKSTVKVTEFDVILMRKDPPFDMNFIYATYLLDKAKAAGVLVVNDPSSIRDCNEKLFATWFSEEMSETIVTAKQAHIREFIKQHGDVIVKPLDGMGGMGIFRLTADSPNIGSTLEMLTQMQTLPIMAQKYLPAIKEGDKRVLIVGGQVVPYCLARIPQGGETRGNLAAGGRGVAMPLSDAERAVAEKVAPILLEKGLYFVGLDLIGAKITEINVTSPTCVREIDDQFGTQIAVDFIGFVESLLAQS